MPALTSILRGGQSASADVNERASDGVTSLLQQSVSRRSGIGGTDVSALVRMHPSRTPWDVYASKTGLLDEAIERTDKRAEWGKRLERVIAEAYSETTGRKVTWLDQTLRGITPFSIWTPDAETDEPRIVDCKTAGLDQIPKWGEAGTEEVPDHYAIQIQWYLLQSGAPEGDIAVLFAGSDFRIYTIKADPKLQEILAEEAEGFWRAHVEPQIPPPLEYSTTAEEYVKRRYPRNNGQFREANEREVGLIKAYREVHSQVAAMEKQKQFWGLNLREAIADEDGLTILGEPAVTYRKGKGSEEIDWESLAKPFLKTLAKQDREALMSIHTRTVPGSRRLLLKKEKENGN